MYVANPRIRVSYTGSYHSRSFVLPYLLIDSHDSMMNSFYVPCEKIIKYMMYW